MDWKLIIADLQRSGLSQMEIAQLCGCVQSTISELAIMDEREPRYRLGNSLLQLHKKQMRKAKQPTTQEG